MDFFSHYWGMDTVENPVQLCIALWKIKIKVKMQVMF